MTCSDEHVRLSSWNVVFWVTDRCGTFVTASLAVFEVGGAVWVLAVVPVDVLGVVVVAVGVGVADDVALKVDGSGCGPRAWKRCWGAICWFGSECCRFRGVSGCFNAVEVVVVAVVDVDVVVDGGCVGVVNGDVAVVMGLGGLISVAMGAGVSPQACEAASQVLGGSVDVPMSLSRRGGSSLGSVSTVLVVSIPKSMLSDAWVVW
jgi:hypothetical protein